jgi:predicted nucleic acid-binding Zn ribbon protein
MTSLTRGAGFLKTNGSSKTIEQLASEIETINEVKHKLIETLIIHIEDLSKGCIFCNSGTKTVRIGKYGACRVCIERLQNADDGDFLFPIRR